MKHLRLFETETTFDVAKSNLPEPCVAITEDNSKVHFMGISTIDEDDLTKGDFIDLGLPSGLKWASCNLGATKPCEYGDYYMWGSVTPNTNDVCDWEHTPFNNGSSSFDSTYFDAHKSELLDGDVLKPEYDAAVATGKGHMPTIEDFNELTANTTSEWVNCTYLGSDHADHNVMGRKFTASNGNSIFIPASGSRGDSSTNGQGNYASIWSSSLSLGNSRALDLFIYLSGCEVYDTGHNYGLVVRPVSE